MPRPRSDGSRRSVSDGGGGSAEDHVEGDAHQPEPDEDADRGGALSLHWWLRLGSTAREPHPGQQDEHGPNDEKDRVESGIVDVHLGLVLISPTRHLGRVPMGGRPNSRMASIRALRSSSSASNATSCCSTERTM